VLNEFELISSVTISYYDSLARYYRDFFRRASLDGVFKNLDPNLAAYSLIGLAIFQQREWQFPGPGHSPDELIDLCADFIRLGISGPKAWEPPQGLLPHITSLDHSQKRPAMAGEHRPGQGHPQGYLPGGRTCVG
jgi:hypothetical protein